MQRPRIPGILVCTMDTPLRPLTDEDLATEERVDNLTGSLAKLEAPK